MDEFEVSFFSFKSQVENTVSHVARMINKNGDENWCGSFHDSAEKPSEIDHHLYEFGSVEYHVQVSQLHS